MWGILFPLVSSFLFGCAGIWSIFHQRFTRVDPKSAKRHWWLGCIFMLLGSALIKGACKHVCEIDPWLILSRKKIIPLFFSIFVTFNHFYSFPEIPQTSERNFDSEFIQNIPILECCLLFNKTSNYFKNVSTIIYSEDTIWTKKLQSNKFCRVQ